MYGSVGATRTRAAPVTPPTVAITRPNCPLVLADTVSLVVWPLSLLNVPSSGLAGAFFLGGGGAFWLTGRTGGDRSLQPFMSASRMWNFPSISPMYSLPSAQTGEPRVLEP